MGSISLKGRVMLAGLLGGGLVAWSAACSTTNDDCETNPRACDPGSAGSGAASSTTTEGQGAAGAAGGAGGSNGGMGGAPECTTDADCTSPTAAHCNPADLTCIPCDNSTQCVGVPGASVCATEASAISGVNAGTCVECTATEGCTDPTTCNLTANTCDGADNGTLDACEACTNDDQCEANHACVPMEFNGSDNGFFCLQDTTSNCSRPYFPSASAKSSINGNAAVTYCSVNESMVSCQAVQALQLGRFCTTDGACSETMGGAETPTLGAVCENLGQGDRCTYPCAIVDQCPTGLTCGDGDTTPPGWCGG